MAEDSKRWVIEITGEISENSQKEKKKTPLNVLQRLIASPGKLLQSSLLEDAEEMYKEGHKVSGTVAAIGVQAATKAASIAKNAAEFSLERYCTLQEDYMSQQAISNIQTSISQVSQAGSSMITGAMSMAKFGPWGMIAGGLIGAASFGVNQYISYQKRMSSYHQQLNAVNFQTEFSSSRLGLIGGSGTEN